MEMRRRGLKVNASRVFFTEVFKENNLYNDWKPNEKDL